MTANTRMPTIYLPHGGGPCFFMDWTMGPADTWDQTEEWLTRLTVQIGARPEAVVVVSAHWEEPNLAVTTSENPSLLFDYHGFPPHTYELAWPAPGSPRLATRVLELLAEAGFIGRADPNRGYDHGIFVPLKVAIPEADIPTVGLSLEAGLDPVRHLAIGRALAPLRDQGVLLIGSGMSYHNMNAFMTDRSRSDSRVFGAWLDSAVASPPSERDRLLAEWADAPAARESHPREEHLLPLMVMAGAAMDDLGRTIFTDEVMGAVVSAYGFGLTT